MAENRTGPGKWTPPQLATDAEDEQLEVQAENIRSLEPKLAELVGANDVRSAEDRHTSVKLAEHQIAIAEMRHRANAE